MSQGVILDHHAYDHGNQRRSQSPFAGEDQPHQGSGPIYTDPYDSIIDNGPQSSYTSSEKRYDTQHSTRSLGAQQGYVKASPYQPSQNSGFGFASSSSSPLRHATLAHYPRSGYTGNHVGTTRYTDSSTTHPPLISPPTVYPKRILPPSARELSHYDFRYYLNNEKDAVYSLKAHLKPNENYPKDIISARTVISSADTSARYNQATCRPTEYYERRTRERR
ncbi:hypothetical protein EAE96_010286 [Botrytis aclada]|nr:hypothetical protein EAE96_010286 [Botrytis aclada]